MLKNASEFTIQEKLSIIREGLEAVNKLRRYALRFNEVEKRYRYEAEIDRLWKMENDLLDMINS